jgi:hypothetical protein
VRQNVADVNAAEIVAHVHHESVPALVNVEYDLARANKISRWEVRFDLAMLGVPFAPHDSRPLPEMGRRICVIVSKCRQPCPRDDVHCAFSGARIIVSNLGTAARSVNTGNLDAF